MEGLDLLENGLIGEYLITEVGWWNYQASAIGGRSPHHLMPKSILKNEALRVLAA